MRVRVAIAALVLLAACSGDGGPDDEEGAPAPSTPSGLAVGLCGATLAWREDLGELVEELSQAGVGVEDVGVRKDLFRGFVADAEFRTDTMVDEVLGLLGPDEGTATQRLAVGGDELAEDWAYAREMVEDFPDREDAEPFVSRGTQLTNEVERTGARWKTALNEAAVLASPELREALVDEPSCTVIPRTADTAQE